MPKVENKLLVHELSAEFQTSMNEYVKNFYVSSLIPRKKWQEILKKSENISGIFNKLSDVDYNIALSFIKGFPIYPLEEGNEISRVVVDEVELDKDTEFFKDFPTITSEYYKHYREMYNKNFLLISEKLDDLIREYIEKGVRIIGLKDIFSDFVKKYYNTFYWGYKYCFMSVNITNLNELHSFQSFNFIINQYNSSDRDDCNRKLLQDYMGECRDNTKKDINDAIKADSDETNTKYKPFFYKQVDKLLNEFFNKVKTTDDEFEIEMKKRLSEYNYQLSTKHFNFFASNKQNINYEINLPKINFIYLWRKRKIVDFYFNNQSFLDKQIDFKERLFSYEYGFDSDKNFEDYKQYILDSLKSKSDDLDECKQYWLNFIDNRQNLQWSFPQMWLLPQAEKVDIKSKWINTFQSNYVENRMLENFTNTVENEMQKVKKKLDSEWELGKRAYDNEQPQSNIELQIKSKFKLKTKGKPDKTKNKVKFIKKPDVRKISEAQSINEFDKNNELKQLNIKEVENYLEIIKSSNNNSEISEISRKIYKLLKEMINEEKNSNVFLSLDIANKIKQAKSTDGNKIIFKEIYENCLKQFNTTIDYKKTEELFDLVSKLECKSSTNPQEITQYYDYQQKVLPELPEFSMLNIEKINVTTKSEITPQPISFVVPWNSNYEPFIIYNLNRNKEFDKGGRPAIYLDFNEQKQEHKLIYGTSQKKDLEEVFKLKLSSSSETYFYWENIVCVGLEENNEKRIIGDYWDRDYETNKPFDFLTPELKEKLKTAISDSSGMSEYYLEKTSKKDFNDGLINESFEENKISHKTVSSDDGLIAKV